MLLGNGDGTFAAQQPFAAGEGPISVTTGDFNGDGVTDLATANIYSDDVSVLLGVRRRHLRGPRKPSRRELVPFPSPRATSTATA